MFIQRGTRGSYPPEPVIRDGIFKLSRSPGIDSKESIPPAYVAWESIPGRFKSLKISSLVGRYDNPIHICFPAPVDCSKILAQEETSDGIFKLLRSPEIDSKEPIPQAYVAWRAATTTLLLLGS
jgi:hypothetical protein